MQNEAVWLRSRRFPRPVKKFLKHLIRTAFPTSAVLSWQEIANNPWNGKPLLAVIVLCHNYGQYIREAIGSIQTQTFRDLQIVVVDDGSTDERTLQVLGDLEKSGIAIIRQENLGPASAMNHGISETLSKYVCCVSADDMIEKTYFEKSLCMLETNPGLAFAYPWMREFGHESRIGLTEPFNLRRLLEYNHVCGSAVFRRDAWEAVHGFDSSMLGYEDWEFWIKLGESGFRGGLIAEPLFNWRRHGQTFGKRVDQNRRELMGKIRGRHEKLFLDPRAVQVIERSYQNYRVREPFLNLSSKDQYAGEGRIALFVSDRESIGPVMHLVLRMLEYRRGFVPTLLTTNLSDELESEDESFPGSVYGLPRFLDDYCWVDFLTNFIKTRDVGMIAFSNSSLIHGWLPEVGKCTVAPIMNLLETENVAKLQLARDYDQFIDCHISTSLDIKRRLSDFGISHNKVVTVLSSQSTREIAEALSEVSEKLRSNQLA
jgi:glycosyltransferase involved in cell wall biosynthesis